MPLWVALRNRAFATEIRSTQKLALAVDPEAHFAQEDKEMRPAGFDASVFGLPEQFDPLVDELSLEAAEACAKETLDHENEVGATLFITVSHLVGGLKTTGRENDIRIAQASVKYFRDEGLDEPPIEGDDFEREIFIGLTVAADALMDATERAALAKAYAAVAGDGYWVRVLGLSDRTTPAAANAAADFLFELQRVSVRPVVLVGAGNISVAFLAAKLAGVSFGIGENEYFASPPAKGKGKRSLVVLHYRLLRNIKVPKRGVAGRGRDAFRSLPCFCGEHQSAEPPLGAEKKPHTLACRLRQAFEITQGDLDECLDRLESWVSRAEADAIKLGYQVGHFKCWREIPRAARAARARAA